MSIDDPDPLSAVSCGFRLSMLRATIDTLEYFLDTGTDVSMITPSNINNRRRKARAMVQSLPYSVGDSWLDQIARFETVEARFALLAIVGKWDVDA